MTGSNCRPSRCKRDALPTELIAHDRLRFAPLPFLHRLRKRVVDRLAAFQSGIAPLSALGLHPIATHGESPYAPIRPRPRRNADHPDRNRLHQACRGQLPDQLWRYPRAGHREHRRAACRRGCKRQGRRLGDGRIFDAAPRHAHARPARSGQGQAVGPHAGNPAADRPLAARGRRSQEAGRAPDHASIATSSRPMAARAPRRSRAPGWRCVSRSTD